MEPDKIEEGILLTQEGMLLNRISIQTILQLLVEKGIITREEVNQKRKYVSEQSTYKNSLNAIHKMQSDNKDIQHFSQEFTKYLSSDGKEGDVEFLKKSLGI